jgi:serine/threonine-protein kinase
MSALFESTEDEFAEPAENSRLGRYQLVRRLASGGMASVYLARAAGPAGFEKVVALKRIHPHLANEKTFVEMFLDEARIASRIDHANVCNVFDFGKADGSYYIAMEFLSGEPLSRLINLMEASPKQLTDPRRPYFVARMVADACEGLHAAHELHDKEGELLEVVHRDVSPQNLFLTYDGVVKVVDFGIASAAGRLHHTPGGEMKGKFAYLAPEQARGSAGALLDRRADIFALGVVLWELLTLKRLFRRDSPAETLEALLHGAVPLPSAERPGLTTDFDAIVLKALARDASDRYDTARDLGRDLGKAIGKAGEVIGTVDLADWLERLIPDAHENSRRRIESALRGDAPRSGFPATSDLSHSDLLRMLEPSDVRDVQLEPPGDSDDAMTQAWLPLTPEPDGPELRPLSGPPPRLRALTPTPTPTATSIRPPVPPPAPRPRRARSKMRYIGPAIAVVLGCAGLAVGMNMGRRGVAADEAPPPAVEATTAPAPHGMTSAAAPVIANPATSTAAREPAARVTPPSTTGPARVPPDSARGRPLRDPAAVRAPVADLTDSPAEPPPPATDGALVVATPGGWANVYDGVGRLLGQTPLVTRLPVGDHTLSLRPFGEPPAISVDVHVTEGGTARVSHPLQQ